MRSVKIGRWEFPKCEMCQGNKPYRAEYDGKTKMGFWAAMCEKCFQLYGIGVGTGKGQQLIREKE